MAPPPTLPLASFFTKLWETTPGEIHDGHLHFIEVLQDILAILKRTSDDLADETAEMTTLFEALHVEDPVSEGTAPKAKSPKAVQYEPETDESDLIFALFAYLKDINEIRAYIRSVWKDYKSGKADLMSAAVTTNTAFDIMKRNTEGPSRERYAGNDFVFRTFYEEVKEWMLSNKIATTPLGNVGTARAKPFHLLKSHPVLRGVMMFRLNYLMQDFGVALANARGSIMYTAHLYNAAKRSASLETPWEETNYILSIHSPQRLFVGAPPTEPADYLKRFVLALGGSASNFARNRRQGGPSLIVESKKGPRGLKTTSPVKDVFSLRYISRFIENPGPAVLSIGNIKAMLLVASKARRTSQPAINLKAFPPEVIDKGVFRPVQLLQIIREGVAAEELHLLFDYFGLHQRGYKLLRTLQTHLQDDSVCIFGSNYLENESELPFIAGYIFEVMAGSARVAEALRVEYGGSRLLLKAAEVMRGFLQDGNGKKSIERAETLSGAAAFDVEMETDDVGGA